MKKTGKISKTSRMHGIKLIARSVLFASALTLYITDRVKNTDGVFGGYENSIWLAAVIWLIYAVEMILRFFPSSIESPGCQKQFARNYQPTGEDKPRLQSWKRTLAVAAVWLMLNAAIGVLYMTEAIDAGILVLISLAYGVCDMI